MLRVRPYHSRERSLLPFAGHCNRYSCQGDDVRNQFPEAAGLGLPENLPESFPNFASDLDDQIWMAGAGSGSPSVPAVCLFSASASYFLRLLDD